MINIDSIYEKEKVINSKFRKKYDYSNPDIFYKQVLELTIEISELAYETKCFKYWKDDKSSSQEIIIAEYADCLMITLCFCDLANIKLSNLSKIAETDIVKLFIKLHNLASKITINLDEMLLLEILSNLLILPILLDLEAGVVEEHCYKKMEKTLKMISEDVK